MKPTTGLGLFAVVALILSAGALVLSLLVSNPLVRTATQRTPSLIVLALVGCLVGAAVVVGVRDRRLDSPYW